MPIARLWWILGLRGVTAILFAIVAFAWPGITLFGLLIAFAAYALFDGVFTLSLGFRTERGVRHWWSLLIQGIAGVATAFITLFWPGITALALLMLIAAWAAVTGVAEVVAAVRLRKHVKREWLLALSGLLSLTFGVLLFLYPGAGALAVVLWIGAFAAAYGVLMLALAWRLRSWVRGVEHRIPEGETI